MIDLQVHPEGTVLPVSARPGARRSAVLGEHAGALRVAVTAPPDKGKANDALADLLAEALGCRSSQVRLLTGPTSRRKRFLIAGLTPAEVCDRLAPTWPPGLFDDPS